MTPQEEFDAFNAKTRAQMNAGIIAPHEAFGDIRIKADDLGVDHGMTEADMSLEQKSLDRHRDLEDARAETRKKFGESDGYFSMTPEAQAFLSRNYNDRLRKRGEIK